MKTNIGFILLVYVVFAAASEARDTESRSCADSFKYGALVCTEQTVTLVDNEIIVRIYTTPTNKTNPITAIDRTFVVVHNNEQKGLYAVKEALNEPGVYGRLVEVVSNYRDGYKLNTQDINDDNQKRYLYFGKGDYCIDPNRIYSEKGIRDKRSLCQEIPDNYVSQIVGFGSRLLGIVTKNGTHSFIVGVHNNTLNGGLSIDSWSRNGDEAKTGLAVFAVNSHEGGKTKLPDNFILVSNSNLFSQMTKLFVTIKPFNIALQEDRQFLINAYSDASKHVDDGSMSLYFGVKLFGSTGKPFSYINIEAGEKANSEGAAKTWQKNIIRWVSNKKNIKP